MEQLMMPELETPAPAKARQAWPLVKWSEVLSIKNGKSQKDVVNDQGQYPIYGSGGIMGFADSFLCEENTVVLGRKGSINNPIFVETKFWNVDTAFGLAANKNQLEPKFLYYFCLNFNFEKLNTTVTIPSLTKANLLTVEMPLPPLAEQQRIVARLDLAQRLIDQRKAQLALMDQLVQSLFYEMFGDPVKNEMEWPLGQIGDLAYKTQYGTSAKAHETEGDFPILRMNNITYSGHWDFNSLKYVDLSEKEKQKYLVHKGELLFNRTNSKELVGKTAVYKRNEPMAFAGYLVKLIPNEKANSDYISAFLNSPYGKSILLGMAKSIVGMANINAEELKSIPILIPPLNLQNMFADKLLQIEALKQQMQASLAELEQGFQALMQEAFGA